MQRDSLTDAENLDSIEEDPINRRRHPRSVFTYPVEFELFSQNGEKALFVGYLKDISLGGAGLQIDDPYGRFNVRKAENGTLRLALSIPREKKIYVFTNVQWVKRTESNSQVNMGISFKDLDYESSIAIEKLIGLKGKDHNMMWNLWEQYNQ
jgi:hypothetical protein